jgi:hypothetical protein
MKNIWVLSTWGNGYILEDFFLLSHLYSLVHLCFTFSCSFIFQYSKLRLSKFLDDLCSLYHIYFFKFISTNSLHWILIPYHSIKGPSESTQIVFHWFYQQIPIKLKIFVAICCAFARHNFDLPFSLEHLPFSSF